MMAFCRTAYFGASIVALCSATAAWAQEAAAPESDGLGDIIVMAQRRSERLQDVPVSVTAFGERDMERRQINDVRGLTENAPSITFAATPYGNNDLILAIRGVAPGGVLPNVDQAVGTYVDGIYYARPEGSNFALVDISSAEVLRGPQGTLFGRNTIGGALNITTNKPEYEWGGSVKLAYGNYNAISGTGVINAPLIDDRLAMRLVYSHVQHDGYGYNPALHSDVADQNDDFLRASLRADLTPDLRVDLSFDHYWGKNHQPLWVLSAYQPGLSPASLAPYVAGPHSRISQAGINPINNTKVYDFTGAVTADLGFATLKTITGYRNVDFEGASDQDGTPLPNADVGTFLLSGDQITQEIQLSGTAFDKRLTWLTGVYYFREHILNSPISRTPTLISDNTIRPDNESMSAFAQATFEILPRLRLTGGVRVVKDQRGITYTPARTTVAASQASVVNPAPGTTTPAPCPFTAIGLNQDPAGCLYHPRDITFHYVPFTVGIDYRLPSDGLIFAKFSKGFRSGGFQQASGTTAAFYQPFGAENVSSYEGGTKLSLFDRRLRLSIGGYYSLYKDIQQNAVLSPSPVIIAVLNAGTAKIYGGEFEATALLGKLRLNGSLGLIHPKFTKGPYKDTEVPTVAKTTYSVGADYPVEMADGGRVDLHVDYNYRSKVFFLNTVTITGTGSIPFTDFQKDAVSQKGYGLLNAQISYTLGSMPLTIGVFGKNLTNEYYAGRTGSFAASYYNSMVIGAPRTYGVSASYNF